MTAYVIKRQHGVPHGLFIDGIEVKMTQNATIRNVPDELQKLEVTIVITDQDSFEYQDADQG